jgi:hypothetical protein
VGRFAQRLPARQLAAVLRAWHGVAQRRRSVRRLFAAAGRRLARQLLSGAFAAWHAHAAHRAALQRRVAAWRAAVAARAAATVLGGWRSCVDDARYDARYPRPLAPQGRDAPRSSREAARVSRFASPVTCSTVTVLYCYCSLLLPYEGAS